MTGWISNGKIKRSCWKHFLFRFRTKRTFIIECLSSGPGRWSPWLFRLGGYRLYFFKHHILLVFVLKLMLKIPSSLSGGWLVGTDVIITSLCDCVGGSLGTIWWSNNYFPGIKVSCLSRVWTETLYLSRHGLWLENEGVTPNCDYKGSCNSWGPVQRDVWKRYMITQF